MSNGNYFLEILFFVATKHVGFTENDFRKQFLANSNTALKEKRERERERERLFHFHFHFLDKERERLRELERKQ